MKILITIIAALGLPAAFWTYQFKEAPDIRYSISASLPLAFEDSRDKTSTKEYIQQIEIVNLGKGEAKKLTIKINTPIAQHYLSKYSSIDDAQTITNKDHFELTYPNLPPSANITLTTKSQNPISPDQITVFHQAGKGKIQSIGSKNSEFGILDFFWLLIPALNILFLYSSTKDYLKYKHAFRKYTPDITDLLKSKKPWYIKEKEWDEIFADLIERAITKITPIYASPTIWPQYHLLNIDHSVEINPNKWNELKETASARFLDSIKTKGRQAINKDEVYDLLDLQWPSGLSETDRGNAVNYLSSIYLNSFKKDHSIHELAQALQLDKKPSSIPTKAWDNFKEDSEIYLASRILEKFLEDTSIDIEKTPEYKAISKHNQFRISPIKQAQTIIKSAEEKTKYANQKENEINALLEKIKNREKTLHEAENKNLELRTKITRQLDAIEKIITNPSYIERIESYDDTFTQGNWNLIKKLVQNRAENS